MDISGFQTGFGDVPVCKHDWRETVPARGTIRRAGFIDTAD
jgi:hypothetical protein